MNLPRLSNVDMSHGYGVQGTGTAEVRYLERPGLQGVGPLLVFRQCSGLSTCISAADVGEAFRRRGCVCGHARGEIHKRRPSTNTKPSSEAIGTRAHAGTRELPEFLDLSRNLRTWRERA